MKNGLILINNFGTKKWLVFIIAVLLVADLVILLDIPFLRQVLGFLFLTILPGFLILWILKLNKIGLTEKFVLSVGLSISFLLFFGLLLNNTSLAINYNLPLSTIPLLISFNIAVIILAIIGCKINKEPLFTLPNLNLSTSEKAFLIIPFLFPALSIFGMYVMNTTDNNAILMFMLFLIPIYIAFVCFFNHEFSERLYPVVIFLISVSLLLMLALRSNHIIGVDTHHEYYFFAITLDRLQWRVLGHSTLDACVSSSLLPTIYQSILNIPSEFLFKILYPLLFSISPLIIYIISRRYVGELYGFLTSFYFMSLANFLWTSAHTRTNTAILFFALAMMTLFNERMDPLKKRILFIVFITSCMVSHYSTTYIFFFIMLVSFLAIEALSKKYAFKRVISLTVLILFATMIFFWYSQVTETTFNVGVRFVEDTFSNLNRFFLEESRSGVTQAMLGKDIEQKGIPHQIEFMLTWLTFLFIGIGIITFIRRCKEMSFPEENFNKTDFLKEKFEVEYFVVALVCTGLFVAIVLTPYITVGYSLDRTYLFGIVVLSVFFVIGGIIVAKYLNKLLAVLLGKASTNFSFKKKTILKKQKEEKKALQNPLRKSIDEKEPLQVRAYLIILLILIPYFLSVTGVSYQMFGVPRAITLNSEGEQYDRYYVHDQESSGARWLKEYRERKSGRICTDHQGLYKLISQGKINIGSIDERSLFKNKELPKGYIYIRILMWSSGSYDISEISNRLYKTNKVYDSDVAIYKKEK
ncbi:putative membrane protein [Methanophagales archaeon]|nr:putative membrane protein [Methanophagales archaeon]